ASAAHRLVKLKRVTIEDLVPEKWVVPVPDALSWQWVLRVFANHDLPAPITGLETTSILIKLSTVAATNLLGFTGTHVLTQAAARLPLVDLRVKELGWSVRIGVRYRKDAYVSPAAHRFVKVLEAVARE